MLEPQGNTRTRVYSKSHGGEMPGRNAMCACSACAGDYEDPDRTAWPVDESDEDEGDGGVDDAMETLGKEFPADE